MCLFNLQLFIYNWKFEVTFLSELNTEQGGEYWVWFGGRRGVGHRFGGRSCVGHRFGEGEAQQEFNNKEKSANPFQNFGDFPCTLTVD